MRMGVDIVTLRLLDALHDHFERGTIARWCIVGIPMCSKRHARSQVRLIPWRLERRTTNVSAAALAFAVSQSGKLRAVKTTPLMTSSEAMKAMKKASGAGYRAPGGC